MERCKFVILQHLLSVNTIVVTKDRAQIGEATAVAIKTVKDAVENFNPVSNQPQKSSPHKRAPQKCKNGIYQLQTKTRQGQGSRRETAETTGAGES